jgi:hypothetical protein
VLLAGAGLGLCILLTMSQLKDQDGSETERADES